MINSCSMFGCISGLMCSSMVKETSCTYMMRQTMRIMEKELVDLFESVERAAAAALNSPEDEDRCLDAFECLKKFPVTYKILRSTQVGKRIRQLTKHRSDKIKTLASSVFKMWKDIVIEETSKNSNSTADDADSVKPKSASKETSEARSIKRTNSIKPEQDSSKKPKIDGTNHSTTPNSNKSMKLGTSLSVKTEKAEAEKPRPMSQKPEKVESERPRSMAQKPEKVEAEKPRPMAQKPAPASNPGGPPKLTSLVYCKDPLRDKVREILAESLCKVSTEVEDADDHVKRQVNGSDPYRVAVLVETAMFDKWGKSNGTHKFKYRSIMFNIKDANNPDFRRRVLVGEIEARHIPELTPEQMASNARQAQNEKLKQKALFNSERAAAPKASTNEFTCGRCKKKECTYYQMQTRSADEPMTTYVTCVNCGNHWKFC
ncbi:transcription elongation factor TFIIS isoform X2 [Andrographis paniculata]|uniref:transcription elongation factor TFIIS isoform X2 n=1 Tax=Andrographis paniculata TaxID=175694 RepID=UPI0021E8AC19|nr:transcription elongation factor TFIIS isoform X2 [Andrographis paniculata]